MKAVAIISGGMDSVTLAHWLKRVYTDLHLISFDYGQRHHRELERAKYQAQLLGAEHTVIDISGIRPLLKGSALTDDVAVPHGHYAEETMRATVVPNRNAIMLSIAWGLACSNGADVLACGVHAGDHHIYPDCRPEFIEQLGQALLTGTVGHRKERLSLIAPFVNKTKTDIAAIGGELGVPFEHTWTCYEGGEVHCGKCGACTERKEAFRDSGVPDPTEYLA
ncbi:MULTISPECIES: 7-cyano-7-deazaguanine synthase QueC [unclassified Vulcanococcus]|jgi:7-cyano-7-deazaguanine synthase|uniref:7-cyano-7-deazaguanine synthase QueC n=1 Tax=unclassified Vulcanococcus TaxID=2766969 RepID=UPI0025E83B32|nr:MULTISPECIES: 7-cyano-7-deazaguanine synthase QueC [unclassified Vulcanococcus]